jgi:hypothetical protein
MRIRWLGFVPWLATLAGCPGEPREVGFPPLAPPPELVRELAARDQERVRGYAPAGQAATLQGLFRQVNRLSVEQRDDPMAGAKQHADMRMAAKRLLEDEGQEAVLRLGLHELAEFERRLEALLEVAGRVENSATPLLSGGPVPAELTPTYGAFVEVGGDFLVLAGANELVRPARGGRGLVLDAQARFLARLAFKVYWSNVAPEATQALDWTLSPEERFWYERWVAERSRSASRQRRLEAIRHLHAKDPAYPEAKARGVVLFQQRMYPNAVQVFEEARRANPQDPDLPHFLEEARRRAR